jgi:cysteinyl-tRNA synthetase
MKSFVLYNSELRRKVEFVPRVAGQIGLYVCGMTVYDYCHIGHARVMVGFDYIVRFLRSQGWQVSYVRNITDIDDKIIARANENNESIQALTGRFIDAMNEDAARLGCLQPDEAPKATEYIDQMQGMIGTLINKQHAYTAPSGDVYYAIDSFPQYGRLSGRKQSDMQAGASERVVLDDEKKNPFDFVLWKAAKENEPAWASPWGNGRPGWHIECSAMSTHCLGNHFDIHGGGGDLLFPHHENEIAQSEAATGETYVNYWLHMGFVNVDGEKMSKSLGNFFTIRDVMKKFTPEVIRYFIVSSHYRSPVNFSDVALRDAKQSLDRIYTAKKNIKRYPKVEKASQRFDRYLHAYSSKWIRLGLMDDLYGKFVLAMSDDFNTANALSILFEIVKNLNLGVKNEAILSQEHSLRISSIEGISDIHETFFDISLEDKVMFFWAIQFRKITRILMIGNKTPSSYFKTTAKRHIISTQKIKEAIEARKQAKANKDYAGADKIRQDLLAQGVALEDSKEGTTWRRVEA